MSPYSAMILAAGLGTRMRAYAPDLPKPLVPVAGRPLIDYSLALLRNAGVEHAIVNTHYRAEQMEAYLRSQSDIHIEISHEEVLLETGGGVMKALPQLAERFFVLNSDVICEEVQPPILQQMADAWQDTIMDALLLVVPVEKAVGYRGDGDFALHESGCLQSKQPHLPAYVFTGTQLLHRRFLRDAPPQGAFSLSQLYRKALTEQPCRFYGFIHPGRWFHVGDGEGVAEAEQKISSIPKS